MKLDVAAVDVVDGNVGVEVGVGIEAGAPGRGARNAHMGGSRVSIRSGVIGFASTLCLLAASGALALDGIDLSEPAEATAAGECPKLIQIKYPFLSCKDGEIGSADGDATWDNSRKIPIQSEFIEGNGYWGPDLNSD